jgi:hypothetical protein
MQTLAFKCVFSSFFCKQGTAAPLIDANAVFVSDLKCQPGKSVSLSHRWLRQDHDGAKN